MSEKETRITDISEIEDIPESKKHSPRPVSPEDESYGELMMRFTAHPVKPKYWFEEFGDHWTCSCGQINKGETCSNCGLERDLLRKLFILHKPGSDGNPQGQTGDQMQSTAAAMIANATQQQIPDSKPAQTGSGAAKTADEPEQPSHKGLIIGIIIVAGLLLIGAAAFVHFVFLPEMDEQNSEQQQRIKNSLIDQLPDAVAPVPRAQYKAYVDTGDMLCEQDKYRKAMTYYNKAAKLKDDESIQQKILDAKFGYVQHNQDEGGEYFETYLNELMDEGYDGASTIYYQYYAWDVNITANNLKDDYATDMKNVNRADTIYFHSILSGGPPGESIRVYYQIIWPDGTSETKDVDSTFHAGSQFTSRFQYSIPLFAKAGKLTFELYDKESHNLLGSDSIRLKK